MWDKWLIKPWPGESCKHCTPCNFVHVVLWGNVFVTCVDANTALPDFLPFYLIYFLFPAAFS